MLTRFACGWLVQEQGASDGGILYGWAEHRVVFYLEALQRHLPRVAEGGRHGAGLPVFCSPAPAVLLRALRIGHTPTCSRCCQPRQERLGLWSSRTVCVTHHKN